MRRAWWTAVAAAGVLLVAGEAARGDTLQLKDGRFYTFNKILKVEGGYKIPFKNGDVFVKDSMVLECVILSATGEYEPRNDEERKKIEKGLVPFEGKWVRKSKRDKTLKKRAEDARKRIEDHKKHMLWRNRYITQSPHFQFEYTIAPSIFKNYQNLLEVYFKVFAKQFKVRQSPKTGGRLKICFYHDDEYYYQVSGAPRGAVGYFKFVSPIELNFFYDRTDEDMTLRVLFHECNHYLVHLINPDFVYPAWLAEGMAEYYGGSRWDPETKKLETGLLQEGRVVVLKDAMGAGELLGLEEMIRLRDFQALHYAWGWAFAHMMMKNKKYAKPFQQYFLRLAVGSDVKRTEYGYGKKTVEANEQIRLFKLLMRVRDLEDLEKKWHLYIQENLKIESGRGYALAGNWAMRWGLKFRAIRYFKKSIEMGEKNALTYDKLGTLLMAKDKEDEAIEALRKAVEAAPLEGRYYMHLGNVLFRKDGKENRKEGERLMRLAIELAPEDQHLRFDALIKKLRED